MDYYQINVHINSKHKPSYFTGSMLRGAMGYALKKVTCINPSYVCEGCFTAADCLFYNFYEEKNTFHDYRFNVKLGSDRFDFELYVFNKACKNLAYILSALELMLREIGLTKANYKFEDFIIRVNGQEVFDGKTFKSLNISPKEAKIESYASNVKIRLLTPLRIKRNNKLLRDDVALEDILRSIYQREQELEGKERAYKLPYIPSYDTVLKVISYKSLQRNSNRQKQRMSIDGIVGEMAVLNIDKESYRLLKLGEVIAVGKQTVMGLGKIKIEEIN